MQPNEAAEEFEWAHKLMTGHPDSRTSPDAGAGGADSCSSSDDSGNTPEFGHRDMWQVANLPCKHC